MTRAEVFNQGLHTSIESGRDEKLNTDRVPILICNFDPITTKDTVNWAIQLIESGGRGYICTVNVAILMLLRSNQQLRQFIEKAGLIVADGQPIVWVSRWLTRPLPERVTGIDLIDALAARAEREGLGIYLLGASPSVVAAAAASLKTKYVNLNVQFNDGYFPLDQAGDRVKEIRESGAQILFVGMGVPRQEIFLDTHWAALGVNLAIGVGGSFDVLAGLRKRAPLWVQDMGLEWLYRLIQEPRRLWKRYLVTNTQFVYELLRAVMQRPS